MSQWQDLSVEAKLLIDGALFLLVVQVIAALTTIVYNVYKFINGRKTLVQEKRRVVRKRYRKVWKRAEEYRPERDKKHPHYRGHHEAAA